MTRSQTLWAQFPALRRASSVILDRRLHPCMPGILHQKMGMFPGCRLSVGETVPGRGSSQERGVCVSRGSGRAGLGSHLVQRGPGRPPPAPCPLPVRLRSLRLWKRFVERRPRRWGWGEDRLGLPASLPVPPPCALSAASVAQGPPEPLPTRPSLFPPLKDLGQAHPRPVPRSEKQVLAGSSLTLSRQRAAPGPTQASAGSAVCPAGGLRVLAWEPLWAFPSRVTVAPARPPWTPASL